MNVHTEAKERSPTDGGDEGAQSFPLSAYCCSPLQPLANQPKALAISERYDVITTTTFL
jgi:hypothetical protein